MTVTVTIGLVTEVLISTAIQQPQFGKKFKEGSSDKVIEVTLIYFQIACVGQDLAWCLQQAAKRIWKPTLLASSGFNILLLHLLLLLLMLHNFVCTGLYLFVASFKSCHGFLKTAFFQNLVLPWSAFCFLKKIVCFQSTF